MVLVLVIVGIICAVFIGEYLCAGRACKKIPGLTILPIVVGLPLLGWQGLKVIASGSPSLSILNAANASEPLTLPAQAKEIMSSNFTMEDAYPGSCSCGAFPADIDGPVWQNWQAMADTQYDPDRQAIADHFAHYPGIAHAAYSVDSDGIDSSIDVVLKPRTSRREIRSLAVSIQRYMTLHCKGNLSYLVGRVNLYSLSSGTDDVPQADRSNYRDPRGSIVAAVCTGRTDTANKHDPTWGVTLDAHALRSV